MASVAGGDAGEREQMEAMKWALSHNPCSIICVVAPWLPDGYIDNGVRQILRLSEEISMAHFLILTAVAKGQSLDAPRKAYHRPANNVRWAAVHENLAKKQLFANNSFTLPATLIVQNGQVKEIVSGFRPADVKTVETKARQTAKIPDSTGSISGSTKGSLADGTFSSSKQAAPLKIPDIAPCPDTVAELLVVAKDRALQIQQKLKQVSAAGGAPVDPQVSKQRESEVSGLLQAAQQLRFGGGEGEKSRARVLHDRGQETSQNLSVAERLLDKCEGTPGQEAQARAIAAVLQRVDVQAPWLQEALDTLQNVQGGGGGGKSKRLSPLASSLAHLSVHSPGASSPAAPRREGTPPSATRLFAAQASHSLASAPSSASASFAAPPSAVPSSPSSLPLEWSVLGSPLSSTLSSAAQDSGKNPKEAREERRLLMQNFRHKANRHAA